MTGFAKWLKTHRQQCGLTQVVVGRGIGVPGNAVSMWENGIGQPTDAQRERLGTLFRRFRLLLEEVSRGG